jgi:hypothetical protein
VFGKAHLRDRNEEEIRGYRDALKQVHEQGTRLPISERTLRADTSAWSGLSRKTRTGTTRHWSRAPEDGTRAGTTLGRSSTTFCSSSRPRIETSRNGSVRSKVPVAPRPRLLKRPLVHFRANSASAIWSALVQASAAIRYGAYYGISKTRGRSSA